MEKDLDQIEKELDQQIEDIKEKSSHFDQWADYESKLLDECIKNQTISGRIRKSQLEYIINSSRSFNSLDQSSKDKLLSFILQYIPIAYQRSHFT